MITFSFPARQLALCLSLLSVFSISIEAEEDIATFAGAHGGMYVGMYASKCVCIYACMYACTYVRIYFSMCVMHVM